MVIVLIGARAAPYVAEVSSEQLVALANDDSGPVSHTRSIPPGSYAGDADRAWAMLSKDMMHAMRFESIAAAREFYERGFHSLPLPQAGRIPQQLNQLPQGG